MIITIGEIVWDIFGDKKILGGAPLNVAFHLSTLDLPVRLISRIGTDDLSVQTLQSITSIGLAADDIQQDPTLPTGQVVVSVDADNEPSFDIVAPAAWDAIDAEMVSRATDTPFHLVFGTLAQRADRSRIAIRSLWPKADLIFYDVNLRPPFTTKELVLDSLNAANVVKLNDTELATIADWSQMPDGSLHDRARQLARRWDLHALAVTLGESGAFLISESGLYEHPGFQVQVADTVGSGDAFFATLIEGIIHKRPWQECLERANRRGSYVAGCPGATPRMDTFRF